MIALSTGTLHTYGTARVFELAAQAGYDGVEVLIDQRCDTRDPAYLRRLSREYSLPIVALHNPFALDVGDWPFDPLGRLQKTLALAQELAVPLVVAHLPFRWQRIVIQWFVPRPAHLVLPIPSLGRNPLYRFLLDGGQEEMEAKTGVTIAIENMPQRRFLGLSVPLYWFNRPELMMRFPHVTLDTTHVGTWGWDLLQVYEQLKGHIMHVHLANFDGKEHRSPSDGRLPLGHLLQRLAADGFRGAVSVEGDPSAFSAEDERKCRAALAGALAFCRQHLGRSA